MHDIQWTDEKASRLWGYYVTNSAYQPQYFSNHSGKSILDYVERYVNIRTMESILDFGCGPGYLIGHLINMSKGKCYGLDFSKESVEKVNRAFSGNPGFGNAIFAEKLPSSYKDSSMDLVISVEVVEHLNDYQLSCMLKETYRILKPDGHIVITTPNKEDLEANKTICPECECVFHRWQHVRCWDVLGLTEVLTNNGFKMVHSREAFFRASSPGSTVFQNLVNWFKRNLSIKRHGSAKPHLLYIGRK